MGALWPFAKDDDVAVRELALALRATQRRSPRYDEQPFLQAVRVVIGPRLLAGRELIEARPKRTRTEPGADPSGAVTEALTVVLGVPVLLALEVEHLHASGCRAGATAGVRAR